MLPSAKRRLSSSSTGNSQAESLSSAASSSRKKAKHTRNDSDDAPDSDDVDDDYLELESQLQSRVRSSLTNHSKEMEIAEAGTIAKVEVVNFMCHKFLEVEFGPKINFVIGHNGSGKSAILTAVTIALGAKAHSTNRGKNLGSLIREGANAALVTVVLTNKGPDAYRHDIYGDSIKVERKLLRDGVNSYKIKNSSGKIVSTKREELTAICDHMSIQVDNPLTILSQDNARQFLNSSTASDKYQLFMRGTQLAQLHDDYEAIRESIDTTKTIIERKKAHLPELRKQAKEAELRYKEMLKARDIDSQIEEYQNKLVWRQIALKKEEGHTYKEQILSIENEIKALEEKKVRYDNKIRHFEEEVRLASEAAERFKNSIVPHEEEKKRVTSEKVKWNNILNEQLSDLTEINNRVKAAKARVKKYDDDIRRETAKKESSQRSKREPVEAKINSLKQQKREKEEEKVRINNELSDMEIQRTDLESASNAAKSDLASCVREGNEVKRRYDGLKEQRSDRLKAYGKNIPEVLKDISVEKRWTRTPVGPLGSFIRLKQPDFSDAVEMVLNKLMNAFVVETFQDRQLLTNILKRHRMDFTTPVIVSKYDMFDFREGEPDERYLTVLRALDFDNEWVKRQFIVGCNIEKVILVHERAEGDRIMANGGPRNVKTCYTKECFKVGAARGLRTEGMNKYNGPPRLNKDLEPEIARTEERLCDLVQRKRACEETVKQTDAAYKRLRARHSELSRELAGVGPQIVRFENEIQRLEESLKEEEPANIQFFLDQKEEIEGQIKAFVAQFRDVRGQEVETRERLKTIVEELERLEQADEQRQMELNDYQQNITKCDRLKQKAIQDMDNIDRKISTFKQRIEGAQKKLEYVEKTVESWVQQAMESFPDPVDSDETPEALQRKIGQLIKIKTEKEKSTGKTLEQAQDEAMEMLTAWTEADKTVRMMEALIKKMRRALDERTTKWVLLRKYIALSAMGHFQYYMHKRGDDGNLRFHHEKQKLEVRVSTGDQFKKGTRHKDSKSLSGGEKSFSQVSLLLALWQGIASPIVCLDEFDVYMDAVNRKQSMKMMMDSASESSSQYILITPQDASNMNPGPYVRVHRLADPERRQS